ncbi:hypothetical protein KY290_013517 [Solanum tuberosum]|uniref:Uncharacterized protein n=1 Tax=Solanum tuberosum TaxID=4113 RepID=A0ABQ7VLX7_SOLTU|nr:hypothetical protein KY289_013627 [Solanum tuberosum]KAH0716949.1 hypothetical protein KY285_012980 [Solanum tuberosum]KAH0769536.1 hypothetical protein KY290_013517 [Solanum tuberosum]
MSFGPFKILAKLKRKLGSHIAFVTLHVVQTEVGPVLSEPEVVLDRRLIQKHEKATTQLLINGLVLLIRIVLGRTIPLSGNSSLTSILEYKAGS